MKTFTKKCKIKLTANHRTYVVPVWYYTVLPMTSRHKMRAIYWWPKQDCKLKSEQYSLENISLLFASGTQANTSSLMVQNSSQIINVSDDSKQLLHCKHTTSQHVAVRQVKQGHAECLLFKKASDTTLQRTVYMLSWHQINHHLQQTQVSALNA